LSLLLNDLRLPAIKQIWSSFAERSDTEGWPAARLLMALAEHEIAERDRRRVERHLRDAKLLPGKTLENFDFDAVPMVSRAHVSALCAGDGWLQAQGYTQIFFGWQADVLPGDGRMTFTVPVARNLDGTPVTGPVRTEFVPTAPTTTFNLSSGFFTGMTHDSYPTVSTDNAVPLADGFLPTLTVRARAQAPCSAPRNIPLSIWQNVLSAV